jgi:hypothetical protein
MERELFRRLKAVLRELGPHRRRRRCRFSDVVIVLVYFWAVINDRPVSWACVKSNWPHPRRLPSQPQMSRRLRTQSVRRLISVLEERVLRAGRPVSLASAVDGKPLVIGPHSHDRQARWGRAAGAKAKGYKLHMLLSLSGITLGWRVTPMNTDEREMARRLLRAAQPAGYVLGDANFDTSALHDEAWRHGGQLVAPRRCGPRTGLGHRYQAPGRLRCIDLLENTVCAFGRELYEMRKVIEREFGYLTGTGGLLTHLPAWVRSHQRVHLWVQAKLILARIRRDLARAEALACA